MSAGIKKTVLALAASAFSFHAHSAATNSVADFFKGGDQQIEAKSQCKVLKSALKDALLYPPKKLKEKRYKDFQSHLKPLDITDVLAKYYQSKNEAPNDVNFYRDYRKLPAQKAFAKQLQKLGSCNHYSR